MGSAGVGGGSRGGPAEDVVGSERGRQMSADALVLFCNSFETAGCVVCQEEENRCQVHFVSFYSWWEHKLPARSVVVTD